MIILFVNRNQDEVGIFGEALKRVDTSIILESVADSSDALYFLHKNSDRRPDIIFLTENDFLFVEQIKSHETLSSIPVAIYTNSTNPEDIDRAMDLGAGFFPKPNSYKELVTLIRKKIRHLTTRL